MNLSTESNFTSSSDAYPLNILCLIVALLISGIKLAISFKLLIEISIEFEDWDDLVNILLEPLGLIKMTLDPTVI